MEKFDLSRGLFRCGQHNNYINNTLQTSIDLKSYHASMQVQLLDRFGQLAIFPTVFDQLDIRVDLELSKVDQAFEDKIKSLNGSTKCVNPLIREIRRRAYYHSVILRNKITHHIADLSADGERIVCKDKKGDTLFEFPLKNMGLLNRLLYWLAERKLNECGVFETSLLYSAYRQLFKDIDSEFSKISQGAQGLLPFEHDYTYIVEDFSKENVDLDIPLFDRFSHPPSPCGYESILEFERAHPNPDERLIYANRLFIFKYIDDLLMIPALAISQKKSSTLADFSEWAYVKDLI